MLKNICLILAFTLSPLSVGALNISEHKNYKLKELNFDIAQNHCETRIADEELYSVVLKDVIGRELDSIAVSSGRSGPVVDVYFNIDVNRCTLRGGDRWNFYVKAMLEKEIVLDYESPYYQAKFISSPMYIGKKTGDANVVSGYLLAQFLIKNFSDLTSDFYEINEMDDTQLSSVNEELVKNAKTVYIREYTEYIPESVLEPYYLAIESTDEDERIAGYDKLAKYWTYSYKLEDLVISRVRDLSLQVKNGGDDKEFRHAVNVLSSMGSEKGNYLLKTMLSDPQLNAKQKRKIMGFLNKYRHRYLMFDVVHNTATHDESQSWYSNQLYNRLGVYSNDEVVSALREIFDRYLSNKRLVDRAASVLEMDFRINGSKADEREDLHSWICKVIEHAGSFEHLELMEFVEKNSRSEKVQDYAKSSRKNLAKIKKKHEKKMRKKNEKSQDKFTALLF